MVVQTEYTEKLLLLIISVLRKLILTNSHLDLRVLYLCIRKRTVWRPPLVLRTLRNSDLSLLSTHYSQL